MNSKLRFLGGLVVPMALVIACSSSSKSKSGGTNDAGTGGTANGTGGAGNGTGGTSGKSDSGAGGAAAFKCDPTPCKGHKIAGITLDACCISDTSCGVTASVPGFPSLGCNALPDGGLPEAGPPLVLDPVCKDRSIKFGSFTTTITGCCAPSGVCGGSVQGIGGCLTSKDVGQFGGGAIGADAGPQIACHYPGTPEVDAGSKNDAGK